MHPFLLAAEEVFLLCVICAATVSGLSRQDKVNHINALNTTWKAAVHQFTGQRQMKTLHKRFTVRQAGEVEKTQPPLRAAIPDHFDAREKWPECGSIGSIRDEADCVSCWAMAPAEVMSDRICIASKGAKQVEISAIDIMSCCEFGCSEGCTGGNPYQAMKYWQSWGVVTGGNYTSQQGCKPYPIVPCGNHTGKPYYHECELGDEGAPKCEWKCQNGYQKSYREDKHYGKSVYRVKKSMTDIQQEIMELGPVVATYDVYDDFYDYKSGIYKHVVDFDNDDEGANIAKIIGWGVDNGTDYWLVANSWNSDWGENGFFRIVRGTNECGIESEVIAGEPRT